MSTTYDPGTPPRPKNKDFDAYLKNEFLPWLREQFLEVKRGQEDAKTHDTYVVLHAAPTRIEAGMVVYADGTDWDPGSGAGMYRRNEANSAWVHLG